MTRNAPGDSSSANGLFGWWKGLLLSASLAAILLTSGCGTGIYQNFASNVDCALYGNCDNNCDDCDDFCDNCGGCDGCDGGWFFWW